MRVRTSAILRIVLVVLFSFGMIAPALMSPAQNETFQTTKLVSNDRHLNNSVASLLEENNEEERGSKDHKGSITFIDQDLLKSYAQFAVSGLRHISWVEQPSSASQPSLFTLFHTFLI